LNGFLFENGSTVTEEGVYTLIVEDSVGQKTQITFEIDKTPPIITVNPLKHQ
jgi:hypothetical protein